MTPFGTVSLAVGALLGLLPPPAHGQSPGSTAEPGRHAIVGRVVDSDGAGLASAYVRLTSVHDGAVSREGFADAHGYVTFAGLAAGAYALRAQFVGFMAARDTLSIGRQATDSLVLRLRPAPHREVAQHNAQLMDATWQPRVELKRTAPPSGRTCGGVDSILVTTDQVVVKGFKSNGTVPDDVTAQVYRRGVGIVLDVIGVSSDDIVNLVSCFGWEARILGLEPGPYALSVRLTADPRGPAVARLLAFQEIDTRKMQRWAVAPE